MRPLWKISSLTQQLLDRTATSEIGWATEVVKDPSAMNTSALKRLASMAPEAVTAKMAASARSIGSITWLQYGKATDPCLSVKALGAPRFTLPAS